MRFSLKVAVFGIVTVFVAFVLDSAFKKLPKYKLAIGILSARENFAQRNAIRSTWLSVLKKDPKLGNEVYVTFLLASEDCDIPLEFRRSKYSCEEIQSPSSVLKGIHDLITPTITDGLTAVEFPKDYSAVAFDFTVIFNVVITGISIPRKSEGNTIIQLWDLASKVLVVESSVSNHQDDFSFWSHRQIDPHLLPKGFVGSVVVICDGKPCTGVKNWFNHTILHPAVEISPILRYTRNKEEFPENVLPVTSDKMVLPASLSLEIADSVKIEKLFESRASAFEKRRKDTKEIAFEVEKEVKEHDDIVLLNDVDGKPLKEVYRNLPRKVISFHQWCNENLDADYIMKTDDDSYVDIEKILEMLKHQESSVPSREMWFGTFRRDWDVDRYGKWGEYEYTSSVYPAYACGSGNVVSSDVSKFLVRNGERLKFYQGEDVSMGIWLSAINVKHVQQDRFMCDDSCDPVMMTSTQHTIASLHRLWKNKMTCDNPCGCV